MTNKKTYIVSCPNRGLDRPITPERWDAYNATVARRQYAARHGVLMSECVADLIPTDLQEQR